MTSSVTYRDKIFISSIYLNKLERLLVETFNMHSVIIHHGLIPIHLKRLIYECIVDCLLYNSRSISQYCIVVKCDCTSSL